MYCIMLIMFSYIIDSLPENIYRTRHAQTHRFKVYKNDENSYKKELKCKIFNSLEF